MQYDIDDLIASGQVEISGWAPTGNPMMVAGAHDANLANLLSSAAGIGVRSELDALDAQGVFNNAFAGAVGSPVAANPQAIANAIAQRQVANSLMVTQQRPTKAREFPLGFESVGPIADGASATITSRPQIPFRGERLIVPSDIAGSFSVLDLRVGKNSQFTSSGAVPARTFQENAVGIRLMLDTAQISQDVTLSVQNIGGAPQTFRAALIGSAVE